MTKLGAELRVHGWTWGTYRRLRDLELDRLGVDLLPVPGLRSHQRYEVCFAVSRRAVAASLRLRFTTFNVELGEGLAESWETGLDRDAFDRQMNHLVLIEKASGEVAGTYRLQTAAHARTGIGWYSAGQYELASLGPLLGEAVEAGRACLAVEHRNMPAIVRLWQGLRQYVNLFDKRYLFGCCSITTTDPDDGWRALKTLRARGLLYPGALLLPQANYSCGDPSRELEEDLGAALRLPKLFRTYCRLGARAASLPAIDREFGTVDYLVLLDATEISLALVEGDRSR